MDSSFSKIWPEKIIQGLPACHQSHCQSAGKAVKTFGIDKHTMLGRHSDDAYQRPNTDQRQQGQRRRQGDYSRLILLLL
jgi:hypothetical protein